MLDAAVLIEIEYRFLEAPAHVQVAGRDNDLLVALVRDRAAISPLGAMMHEPPICATPSSTPALAAATTQVAFW